MSKRRMTARPQRGFRVLVATDGSTQARNAVAMTTRFPWPERTHVKAVVARTTRAEFKLSILLAALDRSSDLTARSARRVLSQRWPDVALAVVDKPPVDAILGEAARFGADVIAVGWRGHGAVRRLVMGSVSRGVLRRARCAVLIVRRRPREIRTIVLGLDGSANAQRALALLARLQAPDNGRVVLARVVEPTAIPEQGLLPSNICESVGAEVRRVNAERVAAARSELERAAAVLGRRGWRTHIQITTGGPLRDLLGIVTSENGDLAMIGARGVSGLRHLLLGSVAEGFLNRCPVPVLVVR